MCFDWCRWRIGKGDLLLIVIDRDDMIGKNADSPRRDTNADSTAPTTYFTFFSHRAQREYYYDPVSGVSSWQLPPQGVVSRLPGSPVQCPPSPQKSELPDLELLFPLPVLVPPTVGSAETIHQEVQNYGLLSIITKPKCAITLLLMNLILLVVCFCTFTSVTMVPNHNTTNVNVTIFDPKFGRLPSKESRFLEHQTEDSERVDESQNVSDKDEVDGSEGDRHQPLVTECRLVAEKEPSAVDFLGSLDYRMQTQARPLDEADVVVRIQEDAKTNSDPLATSSENDVERHDSRMGLYELGTDLSDLQDAELGEFVLEEVSPDIDPSDVVFANGFVSTGPTRNHEAIELSIDDALLMDEYRDSSTVKGITDAPGTGIGAAMATAEANQTSAIQDETDEIHSKGMGPVADCFGSPELVDSLEGCWDGDKVADGAEPNEPLDSTAKTESEGNCNEDGTGIYAHPHLAKYRSEALHDENDKIVWLAELTKSLIHETSILLERIAHDAMVAGFSVEENHVLHEVNLHL
jgi:hypothetical protein